MKISIVIVSYNTKNLINNCLQSIINKTKLKKENYEIIVIDNHSSDESVKVIKKLKESHPDVVIKLLTNSENKGFAKAVNQGIETAQGKHVLLLNSDTEIEPGSLKQLLQFAQENDDVGVVGPRLVNPDGTIQPSCYNFPTITNAIKEFWFGQKNTFTKYYPQSDTPTEVDALVGAAFLISNQALHQVGKLNEKFFLYYEDLDYCRRIWQQNLKVYYLPKVKVIHQHGASGKKISDKTNKWLVESSKKYHGAVKHYLINTIIWIGQKVNQII